jgi:signal transduction histidine kinase
MANQNTLTVYASLQKIILNTNDTDKLLSNLIENAYTQLPSIGLNPLYLCGIFLDENHQIMNLCIRDSQNNSNNLDSLHETNGIYSKINALLNKTGDGKNLADGKIVSVADIKAILPDTFTDADKVKSIQLLPIILDDNLKGIVVYGLDRAELSQEEAMLLHAITDLAGSAYKVKDTQDSLTNITQELYKTNIQLRQLDKMKDQLIAVTSHELRTPATVVQNYLWMMTNKPDAETKLGPKDKERLQNSFLSIQTLIRLISDILDVSKIESNRLEINIQEIDYDELLTSTIKEAAHSGKKSYYCCK